MRSRGENAISDHTRDDDLVSVIVTCFNQARFLGEAIESIRAQHHRPLEVIVVDDGSTDDTAAVAKRYPEAHYLFQPNRGLAAARNTGIARSNGGFIAFLDADDRLLPEALSLGMRWLRDHPNDAFVSGHYRFRYADGVRLAERKPPASPDRYCALLQCNYITMHGTVLYRREAISAVGGFDTALPACEDYDLYLRLARVYPIGLHHTIVAEYRQHDANMTRDAGRMLQSAEAALRKQWPHVAHEPRYRAAYARGMRFWHDLYGIPLCWTILHDLRRSSWSRVGRNLVTLLRHDPVGVIGRGACRLLVSQVQRQLHRWRFRGPRRIGAVDFGVLRSVTPISRQFGFDRGQPVDRYYIESFLAACAADIHGHVLEIGDDAYTRAFGGAAVRVIDVLHVTAGNPAATVVADLAHAEHLPSDTFDCIVFTQTLHLIYDMAAAVRTLRRVLRTGGVVLATVPGISQISDDEWNASWYWSLTPRSTQRLFTEEFGEHNVTVEAHGNVLVATAFLHGLVRADLTAEELSVRDPLYPVVITVRAVKSAVTAPDA